MLAAYLDRRRAHVRAVGARLGAAAELERLTRIEHHWFEAVMAGARDRPPVAPKPGGGRVADAGGGTGCCAPAGGRIGAALAAYDAQCARSRRIAARLEQRSAARRTGPAGRVSLRWVLLHVLEETALSAGRLEERRSRAGAAGPAARGAAVSR
ncbi:hypothetical protein GCM10027440_51400 [Nocardiopsis coralliicola]